MNNKLPIRVIRSEKRTRTSAARVVDGVIEVRIPAHMSASQESETVANLTRRIQHKRAVDSAAVDLPARAAALSKAYELPHATEIRWATNQRTRWGSCSISDGVIRVSSRLASVPDWVLDSVILHELTHLAEPGHNERFYALMARYPRLERAEGFLDAMSLGYADDRFII